MQPVQNLKVRCGPSGVHLFYRHSGLNILCDEFRVPVALWASAPRQISIALTNACDLSCSYCYAPKHRASLKVEQLMPQAVHWYRKAAEHDQANTDAKFNLGLCYSIAQDFVKAVHWYRKAAEQGHERARDALEDVLSRVPNDQDFFMEDGVIAYGRRGRQLVSAFYELIKGTLPAITVAFDDRDGDEGSSLAQGKDAAIGVAIQFCISVLWEPARAHYGARLGSLFVDALFDRFYGRLPHDELFQMYMDYPLPGQDQSRLPPTKPGRLPGGRIFQFIFDMVGHPDVVPLIILSPIVGQLMLDGKAVFDSQDPEKIAGALVQTLFPRLTRRLERPQQQKDPIS